MYTTNQNVKPSFIKGKLLSNKDEDLKNKDADLQITEGKIYTILGGSATGKEIYANGIMSVSIKLVITFDRDLTSEEYDHFLNATEFGYYDDFEGAFIPINKDKHLLNAFIDNAGFYKGISHKESYDGIFYEATPNELVYLKAEHPSVVEGLKNNTNLNPNQCEIITLVRAGPKTISREMSYRITMPNGEEILTHLSTESAYATLELFCLPQPSVSKSNSNGISALIDGVLLVPDSGYQTSHSFGIADLKLKYDQTGSDVDVFAMYSPDKRIMQHEWDYSDDYDTFMYRYEHGFRLYYSPGDVYISTGLNTVFHWNCPETLPDGKDTKHFSRKSFSIWNPFRIKYKDNLYTLDIYNRNVALGNTINKVVFSLRNHSGVEDGYAIYRYPMTKEQLPDILPTDMFSANLLVGFTDVTSNVINRDDLIPRPSEDALSITSSPDSGGYNVARVPMIVVDRYGNRHDLTLLEAKQYSYNSGDNPHSEHYNALDSLSIS